MSLLEFADVLGPTLLSAISRRGYTDLTAVQRAVLDPALAGRDLRISSQTGSGKTLAIGLSLRSLVPAEPEGGRVEPGPAKPRALIVAPTRELAHQVEHELEWLYAGSGVRLATTTGGSSYREEHRALARGPAVVVGTPGRLLDHLQRGSLDPSQVDTVVLDEADRMLELGFREDLEQLFARVPEARATHLVSATFPHQVRALADRLQREPAHVQGTRLGAANADIDHVVYVIDPAQRLDALINLLLAHPEDRTVVFVRTRADAAHVANELVMAGFAASALSGEMEQNARTRTLAAFRNGALRVLVATDVAARGIDVQDVSRVVHGELPTSPDAYTHRAGRTGRAGRKGTSSLLVAPSGVVHATRLLRALGVAHRIEPIPSAAAIRQSHDARLFAELTAEQSEHDADVERWAVLAERLLEAGDVPRSLARLLARAHHGRSEAREVRQFPVRAVGERRGSAARPDQERAAREVRQAPVRAAHERRGPAASPARERAPREVRHAPVHAAGERRGLAERPARERARRAEQPVPVGAPDERRGPAASQPAERGPQRKPRKSPPAGAAAEQPAFTSFHVSWGKVHGADARRILAMVCRRGQIRGRDVGAIRVEPRFSVVQVASAVAPAFARAASRPDPREPEIVIRLDRAQPVEDLEAARAHLRTAQGGGKRLERRRGRLARG